MKRRLLVGLALAATAVTVGIILSRPTTQVKPLRLCDHGLVPVSLTGFCTHGEDPFPNAGCTGLGCLLGIITQPSPINPAPEPPPCIEDGDPHRVHLFYAYQGTSDYGRQAPLIRGAAGDADRFLAASTGQHYRFLCANGEVVVTSLRVAGGDLGSFITAARAAGYTRSDRIYVGMGSGEAATATIDNDDRKTASNANNVGPAYSVAGGGTFMHEIGHNLGAVQLSAPHSSKAWHCYDGADVMCYQDTGSYFMNGGKMTGTCKQITWDCGRDDYANLDPGLLNYLRGHWSTTDSAWLTRP